MFILWLNVEFQWIPVYEYDLRRCVSKLLIKLYSLAMEMQSYENCDDRNKNYDISPLHFNKIMLEIAELRSRSLLFDIVIKSGDKSFHVSDKK